MPRGLDIGRVIHLAGEHDVAAQTRQFGLSRAVGPGFGEAADMHGRQIGERLQHVMRADLVAPVGRERQPVGEDQDFAHPSPRAISGPSRLATASGSRFHSAMRAE